MSISTEKDLQGMKAIGEVVAHTLKKMQDYARPGMSTRDLDEFGGRLLAARGAVSAPQKDYGFPGYTCISLNHEVCHGIPADDRCLEEGDLVNIDVSAELAGYYADNGCSFVLGTDQRGLQPLVAASRTILLSAIEKIRPRLRVAELGGYIHQAARAQGFTVVKNLCGHGIGRRLHEAPSEIPCFRDRYNRERFQRGAVIALETFISTGAERVFEMADGWTMQTPDRSFVAQHEHTLIVTDDRPIILTAGNGI